jgi:hypothetical protein
MDHGVFEASDASPSKPARRGFLQRVRDIIGHLQALDLEALPGLIAKFEASQRNDEAALSFPCPATLELISPLELKTLGRYQLENRCRALANPTDDTGFGSHLLLEGYWEMWLTIFFARHLHPGITVIDVGANFGYYSVLFGALVEDTGHIYAVEPNPAVATAVAAIDRPEWLCVAHDDRRGRGGRRPRGRGHPVRAPWGAKERYDRFFLD